MVDQAFTPFAPRRLAQQIETARPAPESPPRSRHVRVAYARLHSLLSSRVQNVGAVDLGSTHAAAEVSQPPAPRSWEALTQSAAARSESDDAETRTIQIREEAIRIAVAACAMALRDTAKRYPGAIARFVDDALRAAGVTDRVQLQAPPQRSDDGDVELLVAAGSVGASVDDRARVLVLAAAARA